MKINRIIILDWYDDIITAIIKIDKKWYISICISKNFISNEKLYYNVEISNHEFKQINVDKKIFSKKDWNNINSIFLTNNNINRILLFKTDFIEINNNIVIYNQNIVEINDIKLPFDVSLLYNNPDGSDM